MKTVIMMNSNGKPFLTCSGFCNRRASELCPRCEIRMDADVQNREAEHADCLHEVSIAEWDLEAVFPFCEKCGKLFITEVIKPGASPEIN